mgnify:CR=1 FL=1
MNTDLLKRAQEFYNGGKTMGTPIEWLAAFAQQERERAVRECAEAAVLGYIEGCLMSKPPVVHPHIRKEIRLWVIAQGCEAKRPEAQ